MAENSVNPFAELPQTLVNDLLNQCDLIETTLSNNFKGILENRDNYRKELMDRDLILSENDFSYTPQYPTTCGVDGSYTIERLLSIDMIVTAGVAVEGLTPPSEKRHWPEPRHRSKILITMHNDANTVISRAIMMRMELELAEKAPHDVVFLDGSFATLYVGLSMGMNQRNAISEDIKEELMSKIKLGIDAYYEILTSPRS